MNLTLDIAWTRPISDTVEQVGDLLVVGQRCTRLGVGPPLGGPFRSTAPDDGRSEHERDDGREGDEFLVHTLPFAPRGAKRPPLARLNSATSKLTLRVCVGRDRADPTLPSHRLL